MGPMFYLVQCEEALRLISAVLLADWPHEFQPGPCASGAGDGTTHHGARPFALGARGGLGAAFFGPILRSVHRCWPIRKLGRDCLQREEVGLLRRRLEREGNRHVKQVSAHFCSRTLPAVARGFSLPPRAASYLPAQETRDQHKHKDNEGEQ